MARALIEKNEAYYSRAPRRLAAFFVARPEAARKALHFLIALSPLIALASLQAAAALLLYGALGYSAMEIARLSGARVPAVSALTALVSRRAGRFEAGPLTLAAGALLSLLLFSPAVATAAIFALAFGDGCAGLVGRLYGSVRPAFLYGKSVEGSLSCLVATGLSVYLFSQNAPAALVAAIVATLVEALPLKDWDNLALPLAVGFALSGIL
ncbi:MAG: phosphatidate cytidylyltransferase [Treponema sp.]|nr:phosphatidate cytidylyltransferase [Treponema sp.]